MASNVSINRPHHLLLIIVVSSVLGHALGQVRPILAAVGSSSGGQQASETSPTSTQPLWSYQVKPTNYVNTQAGQAQPHYANAASTIFDAFQGLSQRQGALSGSPFLSILPIILIAAGGFMLLLPLLTMMMASPFGGAFGGGFNGANGFGYPPQFGKKRSLNAGPGDPSLAGSRSSLDLFEHVSSAIEELAKKYSPTIMAAVNHQQAASASKRSKSMSSDTVATATGFSGNHRPVASGNTNDNQDHSNVVANNNSSRA